MALICAEVTTASWAGLRAATCAMDKALKLAVLSAAIAVVDHAATTAGEYDEIDVMPCPAGVRASAKNCLSSSARVQAPLGRKTAHTRGVSYYENLRICNETRAIHIVARGKSNLIEHFSCRSYVDG